MQSSCWVELTSCCGRGAQHTHTHIRHTHIRRTNIYFHNFFCGLLLLFWVVFSFFCMPFLKLQIAAIVKITKNNSKLMVISSCWRAKAKQRPYLAANLPTYLWLLQRVKESVEQQALAEGVRGASGVCCMPQRNYCVQQKPSDRGCDCKRWLERQLICRLRSLKQ